MKAIRVIILLIVFLFTGYSQQQEIPEYLLEEVVIYGRRYKLRKRYSGNRFLLSRATVGFKAYEVLPGKDTTLEYITGTKIHIPEGAFNYKDTVVVFYREVRNSVDIFLERISMRTTNGKLLNSAGMFEIIVQGKNGEKVKFKKPIIVENYPTTFTEEVPLWYYDSRRKRWKKLKNKVKFNYVSLDEAVKYSRRVENQQNFPADVRGVYSVNIDRSGFYNCDTVVLRPIVRSLRSIDGKIIVDFGKDFKGRVKGDFSMLINGMDIPVYLVRRAKVVIRYENSNAIELMSFREAQRRHIGSTVALIEDKRNDRIFICAGYGYEGTPKTGTARSCVVRYRRYVVVDNEAQARYVIARWFSRY